MAAPAPSLECPKCRHSNPSGSMLCANCSSPLSSEDLTLTEAIGDGWSVATPVQGENVAAGLVPGRVIGNRYEIITLLGEGGMGAVFKAMDRQLDRLVAVKVIRPELAGHPTVLHRFKQELLLARQITHRNVIRIFDLGVADGLHFITMDFVQGRDLNSLLEERKLTPKETVGIIRQVAEALDAAHSESVVHRDLKPHNIMLSDAGRVYVMDFGLARSVEATGITRTGALLGTPAYMSPEQAKGTTVDTRSDLFSLGVIFYEMLTGEVPFKADTVLGMLLKRTQEPPVPPVEVNPAIPAPLSQIVMKCLGIDPANRYQTASELIEDLRSLEGESAAGSTVDSRVKSRSLVGSQGIVTPRFRLMAESGTWKWIFVSLVMGVILLGSVAVWLKLFRAPPSAAQHPTVTVLVADLSNHTGDPIFDGTLEPMLNVAMEAASFVNAFNRGEARRLAARLPNPTDKLDEQAARLIAVNQGLGAIITGSLSRREDGYRISLEAMEAASGKTIASAEVNAPDKNAVLLAIPKLVAPIRKALGDTTPESVQLSATLGTFTAASLEVVHEYGVAMEQQFAGKMGDALQSFSRAAELDPNFARAYIGLAAINGNLGQLQDAEKYVKLAMEHVDRMTDRERYRIRGLYYSSTANWQHCVEEYSDLVKQYPADVIGHNNLARCYKHLRDLPRAIEQLRRAVQILPNNLTSRTNLSLYASYAGDSEAAEREARAVLQLNPSYENAYVALAYTQLVKGQAGEAIETYRRLEKISKMGSSLAAPGLADLALYEGRLTEAATLFEQVATSELAAKRLESAAANYAGLAYVQLLRGKRAPAAAALEKALSNSKSVKLRFAATRMYITIGEAMKARELAAGFGSEPESQAYAKLIEGEAALQDKNPRQAIPTFIAANNLADTWIGRFDLGHAYLEAGLFVEADSQFDRSIKRRGETLDVLDYVPTYGYLPDVYYYQGRVREGLKNPGSADSYRLYLDIRGKAGEDPLLPDVRRRLSH